MLMTATLPRGEIEEALTLDPPAELVLDVVRMPEESGESHRWAVNVAWTQQDLQSVLDGTDADAITFSFDPSELERAIEGSEVEGHGLRETAAVLTIAAAAAAAGASGALGAVSEGTSLSDRALAAPAATTVHTEASLTERGIAPGTIAAVHTEASLTERGIAPGVPAASHDEATFAARGIDPGTVPARHDEATFAARGIDAGTIQAVHDEASLTARGIDTGAPPVTTDAGSGIEVTIDPETVAGVTGAVLGAGLLIAAAAFATRRREPGTV
jgi:hypothetical protein